MHHQQPKYITSQSQRQITRKNARSLFDHKEEYSTRRTSTKTYYDKTMITIFVTIISLLRIPLSSSASSDYRDCPSQCSCSVARTVFCNNKGFTAVPGDFSSKVQELYLFNNNITNLPRQSMGKLSHLKLLDISGNRITNHALWDGVFSSLSDLENLMIQENKITRINADMFKGLKRLARIYLQNNEISTIDEGAFNNLPSLVELKLQNNRLASFPRLEFTPNLLLLDLSHNKLRVIRDMALATVNLEKLNLQDNQLSQLRTSVFDDTSKLTNLDISDNRLTAVPQIIKSLSGLHAFNMSVNKIETIPRDTFQLLVRLKVLDLHDMLITSLPHGIIPHGVILNVIDIRQNKLTCDCNLGWLPQHIRIFEQAFVDVDQVTCYMPERLRNRKIKDLSPRIDFRCTDEDLMNASLLPEPPKTTTTKSPNNESRKPTVDPCDVFTCFNGGTCVVTNFLPRCICRTDWTGQLCQKSLTTSTTTTTQSTTTKKSNSKQPSGRPQLFINSDSITETSVEIILPQTNLELLVSVSEIGNNHKPTELRITPRVHPFKVMGLEAGKVYNICIHSPLSNRGFVALQDSLCGTVKTDGKIRVISGPIDKETPPVRVDPSPDKENEIPQEGAGDKGVDDNEIQPGFGNSLHGENVPVTEASNNGEFQILYPALGAGIGAIIIIVLLVMFFTCYKRKRMIKMKEQNHNNNDPIYTQGTAVDATSGMTEMEMATVVHHHHHNHYNAGITANKGKGAAATKPKPKLNVQQSSFISNDNARRSTSPNKTSSLGRSSVSSNSTSGTLQTRYIDTPRHYTPGQSYPSQPSTPQNYDMIPQNARTNECVYRNHQNNNNSIPVMQCVPQSGHYSPENMDELAPLVTGVTMYGQGGVPMEYRDPQPYHPNENQIRNGADNYHMFINSRNPSQYPQPGPINYPQTNPSRSAFQPIQSPRNNSVRTPTSESGPITTHVNTAHVMPTSSCMNRNVLNENVLLYQEGIA